MRFKFYKEIDYITQSGNSEITEMNILDYDTYKQLKEKVKC